MSIPVQPLESNPETSSQEALTSPIDGDLRLLMETCFRYESTLGSDHPKMVIDVDVDVIERIYAISQLVGKVIGSEEQLFRVRQSSKTSFRVVSAVGRMGRDLLRFSSVDLSDLVTYFPAHKLHPFVQVFWDHFWQPLWGSSLIRALSDSSKDRIDKVADALNQQVEALRASTKTPEFRRQLKSVQRTVNKNRKNFTDYLEGLFGVCGRLLVIRLDLSYHEEDVQRQNRVMRRNRVHQVYQISGEPVKYIDVPAAEAPQGHDEVLQIGDVMQHRERFIKHLRKYCKTSLRGYAWKMEYGLLKGYHHHVVILLDGSQVREDVTIGRALGEHWRRVITGDRGLYYNCNAEKSTYRHCAVGMQRHDDPELWLGLSKVVDYLTKPDLYVRLDLPDNKRTFGKGGLPKSVTQVKRGRPRRRPSTPAPA